MTSPRVTYAARHDATAETEISAFANVYRLILAKKRGRLSDKNGPDDAAERSGNDYSATPNYTG